jgi:hypothetical protein
VKIGIPIFIHSNLYSCKRTRLIFSNRDTDGAGLWRSFAVEVGTPPKKANVFISTAGNEVWVVDPQGCPAGSVYNCATLRGVLISVEASSSFEASSSTFEDLGLEVNLRYTGNGIYGFDNVTLGYSGSSGTTTLEHMVVAGIAAIDFPLGIFGLDQLRAI